MRFVFWYITSARFVSPFTRNFIFVHTMRIMDVLFPVHEIIFSLIIVLIILFLWDHLYLFDFSFELFNISNSISFLSLVLIKNVFSIFSHFEIHSCIHIRVLQNTVSHFVCISPAELQTKCETVSFYQAFLHLLLRHSHQFISICIFNLVFYCVTSLPWYRSNTNL